MTDLVADVLGGEFSAQDPARTHRVHPAGDGERGRFADLLTWPALNEILGVHRLEPPRLRFVRDGETVPEAAYSQRRTSRYGASWNAPLPHLVHAQLRDGATLVLSTIDELHPPIRDAATALERRLRTGVQANLYASWTARPGFGVHWDDHDVVVVQISGAKVWRIYGPTRSAPLFRDVTHDQTAPDEPIDEFTLRAGDVLHVPRGWWHAAAASAGEPSLHLSFGLSPHTGVDLLGWLVDELRVHEVLRADVPLAGAAQVEWRGEVAKLIAERLDDPGLVPAYLSARDAVHAARHNFALPHGVTEELPADPGLRVRLTTPRAVVRRDGPAIAVEAAGQRWVLAAQAAPLIESLVAGRPATLGALAEAAEITPEQAAEVLARLVTAGVVAVEES